MTEAALLARLVAQGEGRGADLITLQAMIEEASELGAARALHRLGLEDDHAARDMAELRDLLGAWRDAKASARHAVIGWLVRMMLALMVLGLAIRFGWSSIMASRPITSSGGLRDRWRRRCGWLWPGAISSSAIAGRSLGDTPVWWRSVRRLDSARPGGLHLDGRGRCADERGRSGLAGRCPAQRRGTAIRHRRGNRVVLSGQSARRRRHADGRIL